MFSYTISGVPATKVRNLSKQKKIWDDITMYMFHAQKELSEQLEGTPRHGGLVSLAFTFHMPVPDTLVRKLEKGNEIYHDSKPKLWSMLYFAECVSHDYLLDRSAIVVHQTAKKIYSKIPFTRIEIMPIKNK